MNKERKEISGIGNNLVDPHSERKTKREMRWLATMTDIIDPHSHLVKTAELIQKGAYPVFYANHTHHANIEGFIEIAKNLHEARPRKMYVPIARSLVNYSEDGKNQDESLIKFAQALGPTLEQYGIFFVPVPRTKDIKSLLGTDRMTRDAIRHRPDVKAVIDEGYNNKNAILDQFSENTGVMLFPEETTEGGVLNENGGRTGIGEVPNGFLRDLISKSVKSDRDIVLIPLGMNGYNYILEPRTSKYNRKKVALWVARGSVANHFGIHLGETPAKVVVGAPVTGKDLRATGIIFKDGDAQKVAGWEEVNAYAMQRLSTLLTPDLQGKYRG